jgi:hypothetical protein
VDVPALAGRGKAAVAVAVAVAAEEAVAAVAVAVVQRQSAPKQFEAMLAKEGHECFYSLITHQN